MYCMPQRTTLTPFRASIPAISHFDLFESRPEVSENLSKPSEFQLQMFGF